MFLDKILHPVGNVEEITLLVCKLFCLRIVRSDVCRDLKRHPNFPSLLAIHDVLQQYGLETVTYKRNDLDMSPLPSPSIIQVAKDERGMDKRFSLVFNIKDNNADWFNPYTHRREKTTLESLRKIYAGNITLFAPNLNAGDKDYKKHRRENLNQELVEYLLVFSIPVLLMAAIAISIFCFNQQVISVYVYSLIMLVGSCVGGLLLMHEYNAYNPVVRNFCGGSKRLNCDAVLASHCSTFMGIPWSVIGSAYFVGSLSALIVSGFDIHVFAASAFIHLLALPYIAFSFYYQKKVVQQWCPLCLTVLVVILAAFITALVSGVYKQPDLITVKSVMCLLVVFYLSGAFVYFVWTYSVVTKDRDQASKEMKRIKYDEDVFTFLLHKGKKIDIPTDGYGITVGNPNGSIHIIKVCNPYCSHCADAQPILQNLVETNDNVCLQMIFKADPDLPDYKYYPIDTFLSL